MRTAYKCRAYPDHEQVIVLNRTFGCVRAVWNRTLAWRQARYRAERRAPVPRQDGHAAGLHLVVAAHRPGHDQPDYGDGLP